MSSLHQVLTLPELLKLGSSTFYDILRRWTPRTQPLSNSHFDIDAEVGCLPSTPLSRLPLAFEFWERALDDAPKLLSLGEDISEEAVSRRESSEQWRQRIREGPLLATESIEKDKRLLQRAHHVLAYVMHFYIHSNPENGNSMPTVIPRTIAVPLVAISKLLGTAPVLTFGDTILWNAYPLNPELPLSQTNMGFMHLFTGLPDEAEFYRVNAGVELRGVELLHIIEDFNSYPDLTDNATIIKIAKDLQRVETLIHDMTDIIESVRANSDPHTFYWKVRPWFNGSDSAGPNSPGWIFEGVDETERLDVSGPSGGQSTAIHALDLWLDIDHRLSQRRHPAPSSDNKRAESGFMERMRRYMPGSHREYLQYLQDSPRSIRELSRQTPTLREPYNAAVRALKNFRDRHIRVVCLYIITMSNTARYKCPVMAAMAREEQRSQKSGPARGTGGNDLSLLLKAGRDATNRAAIQ